MKRRLTAGLISPSTIKFIDFARKARDYSVYDFIHGYVYARWPYLYIEIGTGEHPIANRYRPLFSKILSGLDRIRPKDSKKYGDGVDTQVAFADTYHGKVVSLEAARQLVMINEPIELPNLENVIPYKKATDLIMQNPDHIVALQCPCRTARPNPCLPLDVCLIIGEPFAGFVIDHHPGRARWINPEEAAQILREEDERGHVHHAFFKDAMLGRFYAICNCCDCCCGAMQAHRNGVPMLASSGYICETNELLCIGCETCVDYCQFGAIMIIDGFSNISKDECMGCGVCVDKCESGALSLVLDLERGIPLDIKQLMNNIQQNAP